jgi:hypothetical protein
LTHFVANQIPIPTHVGNELRKVLRRKFSLYTRPPILLASPSFPHEMAVGDHAFVIVAGVQYLFIVIGISPSSFGLRIALIFVSDGFGDCGRGKSECTRRQRN